MNEEEVKHVVKVIDESGEDEIEFKELVTFVNPAVNQMQERLRGYSKRRLEKVSLLSQFFILSLFLSFFFFEYPQSSNASLRHLKN